MIRAGHFGSDFNMKFLLCLVAGFLVFWDMQKNRRKDYLWVFLFGALTWTFAEVALQAVGTRVMPSRLLFGFALPLPISALLQGVSEGATIAVMGIFVGDRIINAKTRKRALLIFLSVCLLSSNSDSVSKFGQWSGRDRQLP